MNLQAPLERLADEFFALRPKLLGVLQIEGVAAQPRTQWADFHIVGKHLGHVTVLTVAITHLSASAMTLAQ